YKGRELAGAPRRSSAGRSGADEIAEQGRGGLEIDDPDALLRAEADRRALLVQVGLDGIRERSEQHDADQRELLRVAQARHQCGRGPEGTRSHACSLLECVTGS